DQGRARRRSAAPARNARALGGAACVRHQLAAMKTSRRQWLKEIAAGTTTSMLARRIVPAVADAAQPARPGEADAALVQRTSTSGVFVPARGRSFQKFSFDFPEPSVAFRGCEFGFRVFTHENVYALSASRLRARPIDRGVEIACDELVWAGGQQRAPG